MPLKASRKTLAVIIENRMKRTLFIFLLVTIKMFSQDTLIYSQKNSLMFSNKYLLFPKTKEFEHLFKTDDGQTWYGKGTYTIKKGKIILDFGDSEENIKSETQIEKIYDKSKVFDTLVVKFIDKKISKSMGHIKYNKKYYYSDFDGQLKIPKSELKNDELPILETFIQGSIINIKLRDINELSTLIITAYDIYSYYHFESNFTRVLNFKNNKIKSDDFYGTTKKNAIFELLK